MDIWHANITANQHRVKTIINQSFCVYMFGSFWLRITKPIQWVICWISNRIYYDVNVTHVYLYPDVNQTWTYHCLKHVSLHILLNKCNVNVACKRSSCELYPFFVKGATLYICMSALLFGKVFSLLLTKKNYHVYCLM